MKNHSFSMAISRSDYQHKTVYILSLFCLMLSLQKGNATQFTVGGAKGWTVPDNATNYSYNQWAESTRFQIGDSLLFVYKPDQDSVVEVNKQDYENCSTTAPLLPAYTDGHTVFTFNKSGPFYFISGNKENCQKNEKLVVVVLSNRSNASSSNANQTDSPSPPPSGDMGIVPSQSPSPSPSGEEAPPTGTLEYNPTPSPASESPSGASSIFFSFTGFIGAVFASSYLTLSF